MSENDQFLPIAVGPVPSVEGSTADFWGLAMERSWPVSVSGHDVCHIRSEALRHILSFS
jgi:hypothetical protein